MKWTLFTEKMPDIGTAFVTPYTDGSGCQMYRRLSDTEYLDEEGDVGEYEEGILESCMEWIALPDDFKFWCELIWEGKDDENNPVA